MARRVISISGLGPVEVYGEADDDPNISFRPFTFDCSVCGASSPAVVAPAGQMQCLSCHRIVSLKRERIFKTLVGALLMFGLAGLIAIPGGRADDAVMRGIIAAVASLTFALLAAKLWGEKLVATYLPDIRRGSVTPRAWLLLLALGTALSSMALLLFLSPPKVAPGPIASPVVSPAAPTRPGPSTGSTR